MKTEHLYRAAGWAAILGGAARIAAAFPLGLGAAEAEALYAAIDILLLAGLVGIYLDRAHALGFLGVASFAVALAALSLIGGPDADPWGFSTYREGASVLALAMAGLSIAWVSRGQKPIWAPLLWFASLAAGGGLAQAPALAGYAIPVAGALFGAGFVAAGIALMRRGGDP
ncbi:MAG: hypothetical protein HXY28_01385 [Hydrogenophilaceae bacterium]|jgi:hypothetical protein|nr:hypothetical protein [Hydrogenophilaceae bacterium]